MTGCPLILVVITVLPKESIVPATETLMAQTCQDLEIVVTVDCERLAVVGAQRGHRDRPGVYLLFGSFLDCTVVLRERPTMGHLVAKKPRKGLTKRPPSNSSRRTTDYVSIVQIKRPLSRAVRVR